MARLPVLMCATTEDLASAPLLVVTNPGHRSVDRVTEASMSASFDPAD